MSAVIGNGPPTPETCVESGGTDAVPSSLPGDATKIPKTSNNKWRICAQSLLSTNEELAKNNLSLQHQIERLTTEKLNLAANLDRYIIQLQQEVLDANMSLEQARVEYMELETESATTDMKIITLKSRLMETKNIVVTQEQELGHLRATVHYLENRVRSLSLILLGFQEGSPTDDDGSDDSINSDYEIELDVNLD